MHKSIKTVFWVERMSLGGISAFLLNGILSDTEIIYDELNIYPLAKVILGLLKRLKLCGNFYSKNLFLLDRKDREGKTLRYSVNKDLDECVKSFIEYRVLHEEKRFKNMLKSYIAHHLEPKAILITKVFSEIEARADKKSHKNVICINKNHLSHLIAGFYRKKGLIIKERFNLMAALKFYFRPSGFMAALFISRVMKKRINGDTHDMQPSVWIEYHPSFLHAFWFTSINPEGFEVVGYLDRPDTPVTAEAVHDIEKTGAKCVDTHMLPLIALSNLGFTQTCKLWIKYFSIPFSRPVWLNVFRFESFFLYLIYKSVFSRFKVKIFIQHQESSWKQEVQSRAIGDSGGIMLGYHWSNYTFYLWPKHFFPQHVYFVWGKMMLDCIRKVKKESGYILPTGILTTEDCNISKCSLNISRKSDFVISIFDDDIPYCGYQTPQDLYRFYLKVLTVIKDNLNFGGIVKSKIFSLASIEQLPSGGEIRSILDSLMEQERLIFLEPAESPFKAAFSSNLSVGFCINSACVMANIIAGCQSIQWDPVGLMRHPFYNDESQRFVFKSLEELERAILSVSHGDRSIGDYLGWKRYIGYFDDCLAGRRMAAFIRDFMDADLRNENNRQSLEFAVRKYMRDNMVRKDFFKPENCWKDE